MAKRRVASGEWHSYQVAKLTKLRRGEERGSESYERRTEYLVLGRLRRGLRSFGRIFLRTAA